MNAKKKEIGKFFQMMLGCIHVKIQYFVHISFRMWLTDKMEVPALDFFWQNSEVSVSWYSLLDLIISSHSSTPSAWPVPVLTRKFQFSVYCKEMLFLNTSVKLIFPEQSMLILNFFIWSLFNECCKFSFLAHHLVHINNYYSKDVALEHNRVKLSSCLHDGVIIMTSLVTSFDM